MKGIQIYNSLKFAEFRPVVGKHKTSKKRCRKVRYHTPDEAREALRQLKEYGQTGFYLCPYCPGAVYHLTSKGKKKKNSFGRDNRRRR